jgi:PTS system mannose-specific IIA component
MVGALVVTHGNLALELVKAAKKIVGEAPHLQAVVIDWDSDVSLARATIQQSIKKVDTGQGTLIFTDMFGGTPTNISLTFLEPGQAEIVTGINLPMLIKFLNLRAEENLAGVVEQVCVKGRRSIQVASELLGRHETPSGKA